MQLMKFSQAFLKSIRDVKIILFIFSKGSKSNGALRATFFLVGNGDLLFVKYDWEISGRVVRILDGDFKELEYFELKL
jgi:hypothetical protein